MDTGNSYSRGSLDRTPKGLVRPVHPVVGGEDGNRCIVDFTGLTLGSDWDARVAL